MTVMFITAIFTCTFLLIFVMTTYAINICLFAVIGLRCNKNATPVDLAA